MVVSKEDKAHVSYHSSSPKFHWNTKKNINTSSTKKNKKETINRSESLQYFHFSSKL